MFFSLRLKFLPQIWQEEFLGVAKDFNGTQKQSSVIWWPILENQDGGRRWLEFRLLKTEAVIYKLPCSFVLCSCWMAFGFSGGTLSNNFQTGASWTADPSTLSENQRQIEGLFGRRVRESNPLTPSCFRSVVFGVCSHQAAPLQKTGCSY